MNKFTIFTISIAAAGTITATSTAAQEIVVSPRATEAFVHAVSADLDEQLERIRFGPRWEPSGIAQVRFRAGEDGRAYAIATYRKSGDSRFDRAALRAVEGLSSLSPLPYDAAKGQLIQANIVMARSDTEFERLSKKLAREEAARIASSKAEKAVLALTLVPQGDS